MDIFELEKEKKILELNRFKKLEQIKLYRSRLDISATDYQKPVVQASHERNAELDIFHKISKLEKDVKFLDSEIIVVDRSINRLYEIFKEYRDEDKQIYIEKKLYKWSNAKISVKHGGISKRYINKIVQKVSGNFS